MDLPSHNNNETDDLATRFLNVMDVMFKMAKHRVPDKVVGQLHLNQLYTLHMLFRQPGMSQKVIAERLNITAAAVSTSMRDLESLALIERKPDQRDARMMCLFLSERGKEIVNESMQMRREGIIELLRILPLSDQQLIVEVLEKAVTVLQQEPRDDCNPHG